MCPPCPHCSGSRLLRQEPSVAGPGLHAPPRSKPLRFRHSGSPQRHRLIWTCVLCPSQVQAAQVMRCLVSAVTATYCLPLPCHLIFWVYNWPTSQTDVDCPELQEVLAKKPACSFVDNASLGMRLPPSGTGCLSLEGDGLQPALFSPLFCVWAWRCLWAFRVVAIPQSGLLAQVSSLRLTSGHSGQILTLSNAACASLPSPCLLVVGPLFLCCFSAGGVTIGLVICGF